MSTTPFDFDALAKSSGVDPDSFHALPIGEKHKALLDIMPGYASLPQHEQMKALDEAQYGAAAAPPAQPNSVAGGFGRRIWNAAKGIYEMATTPPTSTFEAGVKGVSPGALPLYRLGKGMVQGTAEAYPEAAHQTAEQFRTGVRGLRSGDVAGGAASLAQSAVTGASMLDPLATPSVVNVNKLKEEGRGSEAAGQGLADAAMLSTEFLPKAARAFDQRVLMPRRVISGKASLLDALKVPGGKGGKAGMAYERDLDPVAPHIAEIERNTPLAEKGSETYAEAAHKINDHAGDWWEKTNEEPVGRHLEMPLVDPGEANPVLARANKAILKMDNVKEATAARDWINQEVPRIETIGDANQKIRLINQELKSKPAEAYGSVQRRVMDQTVQGLREQLDKQLIKAGETGVKETNRQYGAMRRYADRLMERYFQEAPKDARAGFMPDWIREYMFWHGGSPALGLSMRIGKLMVPTEGGRLVSAFRDLARTNLAPQLPVTPAYVGKRPIALLGQGPTITPAPDLAAAPYADVPPRTGTPPTYQTSVPDPLRPKGTELARTSASGPRQTPIIAKPAGSPPGQFEAPRNVMTESGAPGSGELPPPPRASSPREVMRQPMSTSRATPTGAITKLHPELKAALEKQAGRALTDEEAIALDRANLEQGMATAAPGDTNDIRAAHRERLEGKGRGKLPRPPKP